MAARATGRRGLLSHVGSALLSLLALGGTVCIVLVPLAFVFHITLIMFKTGSMTPTIPTGSLAVVRQIPASAIHVGDVVTVDRPRLPPVTHRVVSVAQGGGDTRILTLRGDANGANDPQPYVVKHVRLVIWSVPKLAYAVRAVSNPIALGGITIGAAAIVTWAFWPRDDEPTRPRREPSKHAVHRHVVTGWRAAFVVLLGVSVAVMVTPNTAHAAVTEEVIHGSVLTLTSIGDKTLMTHMVPAVPVPWQVGVAAHPKNPGTVRISLAAQGDLATDRSGLQVTVRMCRVRWVDEACSTGATMLLGPGPASDVIAGSVALTSMPSTEQRWILVDASLPASRARSAAGSADLVVTASGVGDEVSAGGNVGPVAWTGTDLWPPLLAGLIAVTVGLALTMFARLRRPRRVREVTR